ncbi:cation:proton antiporter [Thermoplasmatales archaeon SG8-52-2]|nr:MAG: cation:proton antiporter [Thermoplasmatales archaeon SG8-52-2]
MIEVELTYLIVLCLLILSIVLCIIRVFRGPTAPDRVVGLDTINTLVIVSMIAYGMASGSVIYVDVAIVYALLSYISTLFIAKYLEGGEF